MRFIIPWGGPRLGQNQSNNRLVGGMWLSLQMPEENNRAPRELCQPIYYKSPNFVFFVHTISEKTLAFAFHLHKSEISFYKYVNNERFHFNLSFLIGRFLTIVECFIRCCCFNLLITIDIEDFSPRLLSQFQHTQITTFSTSSTTKNWKLKISKLRCCYFYWAFHMVH